MDRLKTMALLDVKIYGNPVLREKAKPIEKIEEHHRQLARDMAETMYRTHGIGLAANQVGLTERIVVIDIDWPDANGKDWHSHRPTTLINPEILDESVEDASREEGCLSLPGINGEVWRPQRIRYRYMDLDGQTHEEEAEGLMACCVQHELDHLNGVMFIDRMEAEARRALAGELKRLRQEQS